MELDLCYDLLYLFQEWQLSVQGIEGLPDNITLGLHKTTTNTSVGLKQTKSVKEKNKKKQRRVSVQSHTIAEADVNIGYTGIDMQRELQISFGKLEAAETSMQVCICGGKLNESLLC